MLRHGAKLTFIDYRRKLSNPNILVVRAAVNPESIENAQIKAVVDNTETKVFMVKNNNLRARLAYRFIDPTYYCEYEFNIDCGENFSKAVLTADFGELQSKSITVSGASLRRKSRGIITEIDKCEKREDIAVVTGWSAAGKPVEIKVLSDAGEINAEVIQYDWADTSDYYQPDEAVMKRFRITVKMPAPAKISLLFTTEDYSIKRKIDISETKTYLGRSFSDLFEMAVNMIKRQGFKLTAEKTICKLLHKKRSYKSYYKHIEPTKKELELIAKEAKNAEYKPVVAIKTDNYDVSRFAKQVYTEFVQFTEEVKCDYVFFLDRDSVLLPDALYECAYYIAKNRDAGIVYFDDDELFKERMNPRFKPDYNEDLLNGENYIGENFLVAREIYDRIEEKECIGMYDLLFRCIENISGKSIVHIPEILLSRRNPLPDSSAALIVNEHFRRTGENAEAQFHEIKGCASVQYEVIGNPVVSIIIPNKDHTDDLNRCIESVLMQNYVNYEIIVVENNSTDKETFEYYRKMSEKLPGRIRLISYNKPFNYSEINNVAEKNSNGDYILLLNNDTRMVNKDCLRSLLAHAQRKKVGAVGAKLLYEDGSIQHAGVILKHGGIAGHCFLKCAGDDPGYMNRAALTQDYSVVTAACLMVRRDVYDEVGGLEEDLKVAFNDVDFCLKIRQAGYLVVYDAQAVLYHYESKSRGLDETSAKLDRFYGEIKYMNDKWGKLLDEGDPYYNVNLSLALNDFSIGE